MNVQGPNVADLTGEEP